MNKEILTMKSKTNLSCKVCDRCCKYRGDIKLTPINILEISKFLKNSIKEFLEKYTHEVENEPPEIALNAIGEERVCILNNQDTNRCKAHKVKPIQCVMFPLMPVDINNDLFVNMRTCPLSTENDKKVSVNKWLNSNNNIYKRNKNIYLKWIELLEEIQPKWNSLHSEQKENIKNLLFKNYNLKKNFEKQILENFKEVRKILY